MFDGHLQGPHDTPQRPRPTAATQPKGNVLVVDDELAVVRAYARALGAEGYHVWTATDGEMAERTFRSHPVDAVVSDIAMPGMGGFNLLRTLRRIDRDVPVILATGDHRDANAREAVEAGALMYCVKPVDMRALVQLVGHAIQLHRLAAIVREATEHLDASGHADHAALTGRFDAALAGLWIAYQPIVRARDAAVVGYEAFARSDAPDLGTATALFAAAQRLGRTPELGRAIRAEVARTLPAAPAKTRIFVNLHAEELLDDRLYGADEPLRPWADRVVIEVTERQALDRVTNLAERVDTLRAAGFRIAVDDLGAGAASLASFARLRPSAVKLDASLVRDIDRDAVKRKLVESMVGVCAEMGVEIIAEAVETHLERRALELLGCQVHQGFLYGRPGRGFATPSI